VLNIGFVDFDAPFSKTVRKNLLIPTFLENFTKFHKISQNFSNSSDSETANFGPPLLWVSFGSRFHHLSRRWKVSPINSRNAVGHEAPIWRDANNKAILIFQANNHENV
jgi:hypothetical protein